MKRNLLQKIIVFVLIIHSLSVLIGQTTEVTYNKTNFNGGDFFSQVGGVVNFNSTCNPLNTNATFGSSISMVYDHCVGSGVWSLIDESVDIRPSLCNPTQFQVDYYVMYDYMTACSSGQNLASYIVISQGYGASRLTYIFHSYTLTPGLMNVWLPQSFTVPTASLLAQGFDLNSPLHIGVSIANSSGCVATKGASFDDIVVTWTGTQAPVVGGASFVCAGFSANVTPSSGGVWSSSDPSIATVTNGGLVTGVGDGSVDLTFTETASGCSATLPFTSSTCLPTNLLSFSATCKDANNTLEWSTVSENNSNHFDLEKSIEGGFWQKIATITAKKSNEISNYSFQDMTSSESCYYRLKMIDNNGQYAYSSHIKSNCERSSNISLAPNPVQEVLHISGLSDGMKIISVFDNNGKLLIKQECAQSDVNLSFRDIAQGFYTVQIISEAGVFSHKISLIGNR